MEAKETVLRALIAFRETVRSIAAEAPNPRDSSVGRLSPSGIRQFNLLASKVNGLLEQDAVATYPEDVLPISVAFPRTMEILGQLNYSVELLSEDGSIAGPEASVADSQLNERPRVFIGCSVEGLPVAKLIQLQLEHNVDCKIWNQGLFGLSSGTLETLVAECHNFDFAIMVLTPDDIAIKRGVEGQIPRDNVMFELGLFMGALGRMKTFILVQTGVSLPSDLAGITPASFDDPEFAIDKVAALGPTVTKLEISMGLI